ncbi:hypothetical protein [Bacteroides thetaiotaomicron]|uniref:hypothetical protein n=1 Tax=Bacteroides thetaiotaomicron TaxID=818 RepID=UPI000CDF0FBA|nr:hypothetical protein [Bacteroides thetaiotaomicron]
MLFFISKEDSQSAIVSTQKKSAMYLVALQLLSVALSVLFYAGVIPHDYMLYNIVALPLLSIMAVSGANMRVNMLQDSKIIQYLSGFAFTFFLCQVLPLWGVSRAIYNILGFETIFMGFIISLTICLIGAIALYELIEKPFTNLLKRKILN